MKQSERSRVLGPTSWTLWRDTQSIFLPGLRLALSPLTSMSNYRLTYWLWQVQQYEWLKELYPVVFKKIKRKEKDGQWEIIGGVSCTLVKMHVGNLLKRPSGDFVKRAGWSTVWVYIWCVQFITVIRHQYAQRWIIMQTDAPWSNVLRGTFRKTYQSFLASRFIWFVIRRQSYMFNSTWKDRLFCPGIHLLQVPHVKSRSM